MEVPRLYLGRYGNCTENVPKLAAFLLLTTFPQLPSIVYMGFFQEFVFPCNIVLGGMMILFLVLELIIGYQTMHQFIQGQTRYIYQVNQKQSKQKQQLQQQRNLDVRYWSRHHNTIHDENNSTFSETTINYDNNNNNNDNN